MGWPMRWLGGLAVAVGLIFAFQGAYWDGVENPSDPNWQFLKRFELPDRRVRAQRDPEQFASFNGGNWLVLCLFGGYMNPVTEYEKRFGPSKIEERVRRWYQSGSFSPNDGVGEFDFAALFEDKAGDVRSLYIRGKNAQSFSACVQK